jgi:hypothetical protein
MADLSRMSAANEEHARLGRNSGADSRKSKSVIDNRLNKAKTLTAFLDSGMSVVSFSDLQTGFQSLNGLRCDGKKV